VVLTLVAVQIEYLDTVPSSWMTDAFRSKAAHESVAGQSRKVQLHVDAVVDYAKILCDVKSLSFAPTMIYQGRIHSLALRNTGSRKLNFRMHIEYAQSTDEDISQLYTVSPSDGSVEPGQDCKLTIRFAPVEVDDCNRTLVLHVPDLAPGTTAPRIHLSGSALRPWCRFEVSVHRPVSEPSMAL
jgi:hydrocephalus-inducing protein